ncbi:MAG TPA: hypothetical protein VL022_00365 [Moheibacter sp.]|nr:hypothetical protein [Moheibacter sp.]
MRFWSKFFVLGFFLAIFLGCTEKEINPVNTSQFEAVYELSEMALLMEDMYETLKEERELDNNANMAYPVRFNAIHTAEMTEDFERNEEFSTWAKVFLSMTEKYYSAKNTENYNAMINACIACHQSSVGCFGPIGRIEKLLIQP